MSGGKGDGKVDTEMRRDKSGRVSSWTPLLVLVTGLAVLYLLWKVLIIFVLAALSAFIIAPLVGLLDRKLPRIFSIITVYLLLAILLIVLVGSLVPALTEQFRQFLDSVPYYLAHARDLVDTVQERYIALPGRWRSVVDRGLTELQGTAVRLTRQTLPVVFALFGGAFALIFIPLLTFFILLDAEGYRRTVLAVTPRAHRETVSDLLTCAGQSLWNFFKGEAALMLAVGLLTGIGLYLVGMPYPVVFAVVAGLLEIVPNFGPVLTTIIVALVALLIDPVLALKSAGVTVLVQIVENVLLAPLVMAKAVGLDPVTVAFSILVGGSLAGVVGALIAIPLALVVKIVVLYFYVEDAELPRGDHVVCARAPGSRGHQRSAHR